MPLIEQALGLPVKVHSHDHLFNVNQLSKVFDAPDGIVRKAVRKSGVRTTRGYPNTVQVSVKDLPSLVPTLAQSRAIGDVNFSLEDQIRGIDLTTGFRIITPSGKTIVFQPQV